MEARPEYFTHITPFRRLVMAVLWPISRTFASWEVVHPQNLPAEGGFIISPNHLTELDSFCLQLSLPRLIFFMAKAESFVHPLPAWMLRQLGAFPVDRTGDKFFALRQSKKILEAGQGLGLFPEGTRSRTFELLPAKPGAARLALQMGVPVVPVAINGIQKIFKPITRRPHVLITICAPIYPDRSMSADELSTQIMTTIAHELPAEMRGVYAS